MCLQLHVGVGVGKHLNEVLSIRAQEFSNRARIGTRLRHLNEVLSIRAQE